MDFDLVYLLSVLMFVIYAVSLGYMVLRYLKGNFAYRHKIKYKLQRIKALDYNIYLDTKDYVTYEKYQMWRFYFPA